MQIEALLADVPVFADMGPEHLALVAGCARHVVFDAGEFLFRDGGAADTMYVIRHGTVAIQTFVSARGPVTIETVAEGGVVGWSWLFPPYRLHFDARAVSPVRATAVDGSCLRDKCARDPALGYDLMSRFAQVLIERLQATRLRMLDVHGDLERTHGDSERAHGGPGPVHGRPGRDGSTPAQARDYAGSDKDHDNVGQG